MPTKKPRVTVTLEPNDAELMHLICRKRKISISSFIRDIVEFWLNDYKKGTFK